MYRRDSSGSGQGRLTGSSEHGDEISSSIKGGVYLDQQGNYQLLKKYSAPCN
jgi:hypothetical protein